MKKALITGVGEQDAAYLAEFLLNKGYEVHGIKRHASLFNTARMDHIYEHSLKPGSREGEGIDEKAYDPNGNVVIAIDERYFRPTEVESLLGDASKAKRELGWTPRTSFDELVREMVEADMKVARRDALVKEHGYEAFNVRET